MRPKGMRTSPFRNCNVSVPSVSVCTRRTSCRRWSPSSCACAARSWPSNPSPPPAHTTFARCVPTECHREPIAAAAHGLRVWPFSCRPLPSDLSTAVLPSPGVHLPRLPPRLGQRLRHVPERDAPGAARPVLPRLQQGPVRSGNPVS